MAALAKEERRAILRAVNSQDASEEARAAFRDLASSEPEIAWKAGTLTRHIRANQIKRLGLAGLIEESLKLSLDQLEKELGQGEPSAAERLLIENVLTTWFDLQVAAVEERASLTEAKPMDVQRFWMDRLDRAHRRFSRAMHCLAQFRKVSLQIQINVADKQVNAQTIRVVRAES